MNLINNEWNEYLSRQESCNVSQILTQESKKHAVSTKNPSRLSVNTPLQKHDNVIDGANENVETMYYYAKYVFSRKSVDPYNVMSDIL